MKHIYIYLFVSLTIRAKPHRSFSIINYPFTHTSKSQPLFAVNIKLD